MSISTLMALISGERRSLTRRMSAPGLTSEAQLRYLLQWFGEFSELQRDDFLPILAAARAGKPDILAENLARLSCQDKPVSLFQCRVSMLLNTYSIHTMCNDYLGIESYTFGTKCLNVWSSYETRPIFKL